MMMKRKIEDVLIKIGVPSNLSGFDYIKEAVLILDRDGMNVKWTAVYYEIGKNHGKTPTMVERGIRHALEVARSAKGDYEMANHCIGFINTSNSSSISLLYRMTKREMEDEETAFSHNNIQADITEDYIKEIIKKATKSRKCDGRI